MLEESYTMSLRDGNWKYIAPQSKPTPGWLKNKDIATGLRTTPQLYDLEKDTGEKNNVIEEYPDQTAKMKKLLNKIMHEDGSRPGFQNVNIINPD